MSVRTNDIKGDPAWFANAIRKGEKASFRPLRDTECRDIRQGEFLRIIRFFPSMGVFFPSMGVADGAADASPDYYAGTTKHRLADSTNSG